MSVESVTPIKSYTFFNEAQDMPKDDYFVVDPCYVLGRDDQFWDAYCKHCYPEGKDWGDDGYGPREVWIEVNGKMCYTFSTCYGDGEYPVKDGYQTVGYAGVDAGVLSFIPMSIVKEFYPDVKDQQYYGVHVGEVSGFTSYDEGNVEFGNISVLTREEEEEELDW